VGADPAGRRVHGGGADVPARHRRRDRGLAAPQARGRPRRCQGDAGRRSRVLSGAGLLEGRLALVTGAASGIGLAIAAAFAREGARVVLTDLSGQACEAGAAEIRTRGGEAWGLALDVTDVDASQAVAARVGAEIGDIDVLVNSAGILVRQGI